MKCAELVKHFMAEHRIGDHDFFVSKLAEHVMLRQKAIKMLSAAGARRKEIARVMRCDVQCIDYHTRPDWRKYKLDKRKERIYAAKKFHMLALALEELHP
jgi:DNA-binding CsgD family transcriptional regulator